MHSNTLLKEIFICSDRGPGFGKLNQAIDIISVDSAFPFDCTHLQAFTVEHCLTDKINKESLAFVNLIRMFIKWC